MNLEYGENFGSTRQDYNTEGAHPCHRRTIVALVMVLLLCVSTSSLAQPQVSRVEGADIAHGQVITIRGQDFGSKTPAAPLRYDDFRDGTAGSQLKQEAAGGWRQDTQPVVYSTTKTRGVGTMSAFQDFRDTYTRYIGLSSTSMGSGSRRIYVSGWYNMEQGGNLSRNVKYCSFSVKANYSPYGLNSRVDVYPNQGNGHIYSTRSCNGNLACNASEWCNNYFKVGAVHIADGRWHRFERYIDLGTPGQADGFSYIACDLKTAQTISGGVFTSSDCGIDRLLIGHYFAKDQVGTPTPWATRYWSELYVDITPARVRRLHPSGDPSPHRLVGRDG